MAKYVYLFSEVDEAQADMGGSWDATRGLLGGKGANLGDMTRLGVPVPPGFTVTTEACNAYLEAGERFPEGLWGQIRESVARIEEETGKKFGDPSNPLLVSCRSGAKFSMPGMMDTVLNIGLNETIVDGIAEASGDERFARDCHRRLIQMFGVVVLGIGDEPFEEVLEELRDEAGVASDTGLGAEHWAKAAERFEEIIRRETGEEFPTDPYEQLRRATEAVFSSWNGKRAVDYRNAAGIPHDLGTAVNIQTVVFGNLGADSATGVCMSRDATAGDKKLEGDYLTNAQGEDVVAGTRATNDIAELGDEMPEIYEELQEIARRLEEHYREMQDMEFTIERGKLWLLQTRDGKRTAQAAVRIACDMVDEGLIDRKTAVRRIRPGQVDFFLHPQLDQDAIAEKEPVATGLNVSPGAAVGQIAFDADTAERWSTEGRDVIMVRPETKPDDVHGMLAAEGILTSRGGRTSHAALVARQFGKPAVVGVSELKLDLESRKMTVKDKELSEGDWVSIDGTTGNVYGEKLETMVPNLDNEYLLRILGWADGIRSLGVRANADYPQDAERARKFGAQGIGLCRTEHMFFESERLPIVQRMIMTRDEEERSAAIQELLPMQRQDFEGLLRAMAGHPVIIRLLDPPLHEFLPDHDDLLGDLADLRERKATGEDVDDAIAETQDVLSRVEQLRESNPMLGRRGVRLGIEMPELPRMQVRAIFEAAVACIRDGVEVHPEVMIPLASHVNEVRHQVAILRSEADEVMRTHGVEVPHEFGTMIEIPRAALTAAEIAEVAEFFSFGTNDLTQTVFGISRDDAEASFLVSYLEQGILEENPFATIDAGGVGRIMRIAVEDGRSARPELEVGICGEHGGDPASIRLCHDMGLDYVSCSPFRVPIARLAAAHAALESAEKG
ncbi:MAG: pyruvate, phosphate dikinase [Acidobacteriota bacterium]